MAIFSPMSSRVERVELRERIPFMRTLPSWPNHSHDHLAPWTWTPQPPEVWEVNSALCKPPSLCYFVTATERDWDCLSWKDVWWDTGPVIQSLSTCATSLLRKAKIIFVEYLIYANHGSSFCYIVSGSVRASFCPFSRLESWGREIV